jgi:hypothetical protein
VGVPTTGTGYCIQRSSKVPQLIGLLEFADFSNVVSTCHPYCVSVTVEVTFTVETTVLGGRERVVVVVT